MKPGVGSGLLCRADRIDSLVPEKAGDRVGQAVGVQLVGPQDLVVGATDRYRSQAELVCPGRRREIDVVLSDVAEAAGLER